MYQNYPEGTNVGALHTEQSHSEKSAVKTNCGPVMSVNVSAVQLVSLQVFLMLEQRHLVGSHGNCQHGGDG